MLLCLYYFNKNCPIRITSHGLLYLSIGVHAPVLKFSLNSRISETLCTSVNIFSSIFAKKYAIPLFLLQPEIDLKCFRSVIFQMGNYWTHDLWIAIADLLRSYLMIYVQEVDSGILGFFSNVIWYDGQITPCGVQGLVHRLFTFAL